jgi:multicomponent Na+:H+ antiporter subunit E
MIPAEAIRMGGRMSMALARYGQRALALALWAYIVWLLITWTNTAEQFVFGAVLAVCVGAILAPVGPAVGPWVLLDPRRLVAVGRLIAYASVAIVRANVGLARRIWAPSRPLRSGMVIVPTTARADGEIAATGIITSLIVDNQIVDLDRSEDELQYHAVAVPQEDAPEHINRPVERLVRRVRRLT